MGTLLPKGLQWYWKGAFIKTLSDAAIDAHLQNAAKSPTELSVVHLYPLDGAVQRVPRNATAWGARDATWSMVIAGIDPDPKKAPTLKTWGRSYWEAVQPYSAEGGYVNFMMDDEGEAHLRASYGGNFERQAALKAKYDPTNLFRCNQNIRPHR
jgi:Berberine and berberine like